MPASIRVRLRFLFVLLARVDLAGCACLSSRIYRNFSHPCAYLIVLLRILHTLIHIPHFAAATYRREKRAVDAADACGTGLSSQACCAFIHFLSAWAFVPQPGAKQKLGLGDRRGALIALQAGWRQELERPICAHTYCQTHQAFAHSTEGPGTELCRCVRRPSSTAGSVSLP